jgi:hypothetical protein
MPRKQNYGFDKRRKEQDRKARKDAKAAEKLLRRDERSADIPVDPGPPSGAPESTVLPTPPDEER